MTPEDLAYLHHILDAVTSIEEFSEGIGSAEDLRNRRLERAGIKRMLTILGEAAKMVSPELRAEHPEIPWREAAGMRDKIVHHYFGVDYEAVFLTLRDDLPLLEQGIRAVLGEAGR
ncbi:DUF86 domain-containing protein [Methanoculleus sp. Wushi-C6]|uniref:DUF86 domain-containing protein n=1 Tax=Methanoculleus caldifontis TaxID=2651577 RepID=A0ABU3X0T8_9EURY|nr:DUF86 domain-containing protein [Methanoculleus sp. Wushi-C6]MDV2481642.1 DUF86 domain-containing protein [Methanoculleus sp. Wushi-C6]